MTYLVDCIPDDNGTLMGVCAAFPEVNTFGEDVPQVFLNAVGAIEEAVMARIASGQGIPVEASRAEMKTTGHHEDGSTRIPVGLTAPTALLVDLYRSLRDEGR